METLNHPWNSFKQEPRGSKDHNTIYQAVGCALTYWELLESTLANTFAMLCNAKFEGAVRAYGSMTAFTGRRAMLDAAFDVYPHARQADVKGLPKFVERVKNFSARRNEIAHGVATSIGVNGDDLGCYLVPASYNSNKQFTHQQLMEAGDGERLEMFNGKYAYTAEQIDYYGQQFLALREGAIPFMAAIRAWNEKGR